jgi:hypothetical protein
MTSALTSLVLSIAPHGEALWLFIDGGAFSSGLRKWKPLPGGILIEGFPRYRLWQWKSPERLRAEVEEIPDQMEVAKSFREFPQAFLMNRIHMPDMQLVYNATHEIFFSCRSNAWVSRCPRRKPRASL